MYRTIAIVFLLFGGCSCNPVVAQRIFLTSYQWARVGAHSVPHGMMNTNIKFFAKNRNTVHILTDGFASETCRQLLRTGSKLKNQPCNSEIGCPFVEVSSEGQVCSQCGD